MSRHWKAPLETSRTTKYFVWLTLTSKATSAVLYLDYMRPVIVCPHVCSLISLLLFIPLASTMQETRWEEATAAAISESGISIFHPSHSDLLLPRRQSAPLDSCKFRQDDDTPEADKERFNMAGQEPSKRVKISRKPPPADRSGLLCSKTHNNSHTSTVEGTRPKEEYCDVHGPQIYSDGRIQRGVSAFSKPVDVYS